MTDSQFIRLAHFYYRVKVLHGNDAVNASLIKHPALRKCLLDYERKRILELEREILNSSKGV